MTSASRARRWKTIVSHTHTHPGANPRARECVSNDEHKGVGDDDDDNDDAEAFTTQNQLMFGPRVLTRLTRP